MLSVGDRIADDVLKKDLKTETVTKVPSFNHLQNTPGLLVNESTDPFDPASPCKSTDRRLCDALCIKNY